MVGLHFVEFFELFLDFLVELLFDFGLVAVFLGGTRGTAAGLLATHGFAVLTVSAGAIEFLQQFGEVFQGGEFVEAEELLLFDLFVVEGVFADGVFEQSEGVEEVELRGGVVDVEFVVFLQAGFDGIEFVDLFADFFLLLLEDALQILLVFLFLFKN